jgi:hypothetical protein
MVRLRVYSNVTAENRKAMEDLLDAMFGKDRKHGDLEIGIGNTIYVPRCQEGKNTGAVIDPT